MITKCGIAVFIAGMGIEALGVAAIGSYRLRRILPAKSPISLVNFGCHIMCAGIAIGMVGLFVGR